MKKLDEPITLNIESMSHDGRGIASLHGKTTFVQGGLSNETVICHLTKKHSRFNEAIVTNVLKPAIDRAKPHCNHFEICGGCSLQHLNSFSQIQFKQNVLLEQLKHFGKVIPESILPPIVGKTWGYRRKARLGVRFVRKKEKLLIGFREKSSRFLADIESCAILHPKVSNSINSLRDLIQSLSQFEHIPQIEIAVSDTGAALFFRHLTPLSSEDIKKLRDYGEKNDFHIYLQPNSPAKTHKIWPSISKENLSYFLPEYQLEMQFYPLDFIQVNGETNQLLLKQALQLLAPESTDIILDLFCGLGNFSLPLARFAKKVIGIEGSHEMVLRAQENAIHNHIENIEFYTTNLMEPLPSTTWVKKTYDKILLDPPRSGAKEILPLLPTFAAKKILYISCNPATFARDAGELVHTYGYRLKQLGVADMFPHTSHIETIALFEK